MVLRTNTNHYAGADFMPQWLIWAILGGTFVIFLIIQIATRTKKPIRKALGNMALGVASLVAVNLAGFFTGVTLPVSTLSLSVAAAGGIPGVTLMLLLNMFF